MPLGTGRRFGWGGKREAFTTWVYNRERKARKVYIELSCVCVELGEVGWVNPVREAERGKVKKSTFTGGSAAFGYFVHRSVVVV